MDCNSSSSFPNGTRLDALLFDWCCDDNGFIWPPSVVPFSTQLDCDEGCYATFPADADIGGIGVGIYRDRRTAADCLSGAGRLRCGMWNHSNHSNTSINDAVAECMDFSMVAWP